MRILELREERNLTQNDIAQAINTTRTNIGRWEKNENEPTTSSIIALANFFECSIDYLVGRTDDFGNVTIKKDSSPDLTSEEEKLLNDYRSLPRQEKAQAAEYVNYLAERRGTQKKNA